jgi:hypothetical protein
MSGRTKSLLSSLPFGFIKSFGETNMKKKLRFDFSKKSLGTIEIEVILLFYFQPFFRKIDNFDKYKTYNEKNDPPCWSGVRRGMTA